MVKNVCGMGYGLCFHHDHSIHCLIINVLFKADHCRLGKDHWGRKSYFLSEPRFESYGSFSLGCGLNLLTSTGLDFVNVILGICNLCFSS